MSQFIEIQTEDDPRRDVLVHVERIVSIEKQADGSATVYMTTGPHFKITGPTAYAQFVRLLA